jgi:hypothetical protein
LATITDLLVDVDLRYRNTFTPAQKLVWANDEKNQLFEIFEIDLAPISFPLMAGVEFYEIPTGVDVDRIKTMTIQISDSDDPDFVPLPFKRNDDHHYAGYGGYWYTIVAEMFYINVPGTIVDDRQVYIYLDTAADDMTLTSDIVIPGRYLEILKLGILERIAGARKDIIMKNNYAMDKEQMIIEAEWRIKMNEPDFIQPGDVMPRKGRFRTGRYDYRYFSS